MTFSVCVRFFCSAALDPAHLSVCAEAATEATLDVLRPFACCSRLCLDLCLRFFYSQRSTLPILASLDPAHLMELTLRRGKAGWLATLKQQRQPSMFSAPPLAVPALALTFAMYLRSMPYKYRSWSPRGFRCPPWQLVPPPPIKILSKNHINSIRMIYIYIPIQSTQKPSYTNYPIKSTYKIPPRALPLGEACPAGYRTRRRTSCKRCWSRPRPT